MVTSILLLMTGLSLPPTLPVAEIKAGMTGQCLTVFEGPGNNIEPFQFVVKGVMPGVLGPGRDLVMVRLQGEKAEFTGVVSGMSGSPCSIDGKLVGALSYRFGSFTKEAIGGITPIEYMLNVLELPTEAPPWRLPGMQIETSEADDWKALREGRAVARTPAPDGLVPVSAPLAMGGVPVEVQRHFAPYFESVGMTPMAGNGGAPKILGKPQKLEPGSAVTMILTRGDVNIGALCTVTTVDKNSVTACGHPVFGSGVISMPMANATILNTLASTMGSVKQFFTGPTVGEITEDRLPAIAGYLGRSPKMVPVSGTVETPAAKSDFSFEVARDLSFTPRYVAVGIASSLSGRIDAGQRGLVRFNGRVSVKGEEPIVIEDVYAGERDPGLLIYSAIDVAQAVSSVWNTGFGPPPELSVEVNARVELEPIEERIEDMYLDRGVVRAGEPFNVTVRLRREYGGVEYETFKVQVPRTWAGSEVDLFAASSLGAESVAGEVQGRPRPQNVKQIVRYLNKRRGDGYVYFMAVRKGPGLSTEVDTYSFLPPSAVATFAGGSPYRSSRNRGLAWEERRKRPGVVAGGAALTLKVEQPN